ncbi:MAG TPA: DNA primase [Bacteroidales bacterium]|nr:DNA primase [Bacteroidales bacterium]HSA44537.1 DNA primase [Bacteroidales bacterium]
MIPPHTIQSILEAARIEEVVGDYVSLKKRGVNLIGLCPFHHEKTPSFTVSPAKNLFKCFGCGIGGNALKFIMEHDKVSYVEALKMLAARYQIEIEEQTLSPEQELARDERESLLAVTAYAAKFFMEMLHHSEKGRTIGLAYLRERGFSTDVIKQFELGYCPDEADAFTRAALKDGYQLSYLEKTGLSIVRDGKAVDRFRDRIIFPVHSLSGRVIAFGGRIMGSGSKWAKYINSPESDIYHKGAGLYGLYQSRNAILSKNECYLVEGYTDVISLHQAGFLNVVASSGTSLTTDQIKLIKRFTPNVTILYDGDEAGIRASFRGIDMILEEGLQVKIVLFPSGEDPDSFVRNNRQSVVEAFLQNEAKNFILFKTKLLYEEAREDPIRRAQLTREIVQSIALIPDQIQKNIYLRECSSLMNIPEQALANEINKIARQQFNKKHALSGDAAAGLPEPPPLPVPQESLTTSESEYQEKDIIRLLINYSGEEIIIQDMEDESRQIQVKVGEFIIQDLLKDDIRFSNILFQQVFDEFVAAYREGKLPDEQVFFNHTDGKIAQLAVDMVSSPYLLSKNWFEKKHISVLTEKQVLADAVTSSVLSFKLRQVEKMMSGNQRRIRQMDDEEGVIELLQQQQRLSQVKKRISEKLGRIVTR